MNFLDEIHEGRRQAFQNGVLEGKEAGLLVGKREGKIETAKTMLAEGMEAEFISRMTKLPDAQIVQLRVAHSSTKKTNTASTDTLFSAESAYDSETLADELINLFRSEAAKQVVSLLINWLRLMAARGRFDPEDDKLFEREYRSAEEVRMVFLTDIEEARQRAFQNGVLAGKWEGLLVGKREGKIEVAKEMLAEGMEAEFTSGMTKLPDAKVVQLRDESSSMKKKDTASTDTLFSAESDHDLKTLAEELVNALSSEPDKQAARLLINRIRRLAAHVRIDAEADQSMEYAYRNREEVNTRPVTTMKEGIHRDFQRGLLKAKIETAKIMLDMGSELSVISEATKLPDAQILELRDWQSWQKE